MNADFEIGRLNRLFLLYTDSKKNKDIKPYRLSRIKNYLESVLLNLSNKYELVTLDTQNFTDYFADFKTKSDLSTGEISKAIKKKEYEQAAQIRDKKKKMIGQYLLDIGVPRGVHFFLYDNRIFKA